MSSSNNVRSDQIREGRYFQGGLTDSQRDRIGWWDSYAFPKSPTDIELTIPPKYHNKPWLLAYDAYGKSWLGWFILQYNNIVDDTEEFVTGKKIMLPVASRLFQEILVRTPAQKLATVMK